jgi:hypothetical protein
MRTKSWHVELFIDEHDDDTTAARAVLHTDAPQPREGRGRSRRAPTDSSVPEIGDEVAAARALHALADALLTAAADDISAIEHRPVELSYGGSPRVSMRSTATFPAQAPTAI